MGYVLCAGTQLKHRKNLGEGIDREREPENLVGTAEPGAQFIQLQMREPEGAERALVQHLSVLACTRQPGGDGGLSVAKDPFSGGSIHPFGQRREHHGDLVRGGFQTIQRSVTSGSERGVTGLTTKGLDPLDTAMLAIADQRVDRGICDAEVRALPVRTGEALRVDAFGSTSLAFDLAPGPHRQRRWIRTRCQGGGKATGRTIAWGARFEQTVDHGVKRLYPAVDQALVEHIQATKPSQ
jgi:hypothetical protein